jgi:hypothetical protein
MKETETPQATPEQLLQLLDSQLAMQRAERASAGRNRVAFLIGGVLFIIIGAGIALLILSQMLSDLPHRPDLSAASTGHQQQ